MMTCLIPKRAKLEMERMMVVYEMKLIYTNECGSSSDVGNPTSKV